VKWIGGYFGGLHKYINGVWTDYSTSNSGIANDDVRESCFDNYGNLWATTWNQLSKFDTATNTFTNFNVTGNANDILYSVTVDNANRLWVGTDGGSNSWEGLYLYDGSTWTFYNPTNSALSGRWILQLKKDLTGKIWGCHYNGLFEINDTTITNHDLQAAGFPLNTSTTCVAFDSYNNKWTGVYQGGLGKFDGTNWTIYTTSNSALPDDKIWSIAVDENNIVWIGTETQGLIKFDGITFTSYNTSNSPITNNRIDVLAVDHLNNLWIACNYGSIIVYNEQGVSGFSGCVYYDANANGIKDANEISIRDQMIKVNPGAYYSITGASGNYNCAILNTGNFSAHPIINSPYVIAIVPDTINLSINNSSTLLTNQNFGVQLQPNIHDITVDFTPFVQARAGRSYPCNIHVSNFGTTQSDNITVTMHYDSLLIFDSTSVAFQSLQGDSVTFFIDSVPLLNYTDIKIYFHVITTALAGTPLHETISVFDMYADVHTSDNIFYDTDFITASFDPNEKTVSPAGTGATGTIPASTPFLTYLIRFQNTGNDTAFTTIVKDTLNSNLDISSLKMISSSHSYSAEIKNGGIVWWKFTNILLPDSTTNEQDSHGYIKYNIHLNPSLAAGTEIKNTAYIYFDFNAPVATNTTINTIASPNTVFEISDNDSNFVYAYPNPLSDILTVKVSDADDKNEVIVFNLLGEKIFSSSFKTSLIKLITSDYLKGIYFVKVTTNRGGAVRKFVKE
jgi:streptogramin lyase